MKRKPFQQITVTEICQEAAIGRKTFYRNFELKEDVLDFYLDHLCREFEAENLGKTTGTVSRFVRQSPCFACIGLNWGCRGRYHWVSSRYRFRYCWAEASQDTSFAISR